jgi:hypothetical protein
MPCIHLFSPFSEYIIPLPEKPRMTPGYSQIGNKNRSVSNIHDEDMVNRDFQVKLRRQSSSPILRSVCGLDQRCSRLTVAGSAEIWTTILPILTLQTVSQPRESRPTPSPSIFGKLFTLPAVIPIPLSAVASAGFVPGSAETVRVESRHHYLKNNQPRVMQHFRPDLDQLFP